MNHLDLVISFLFFDSSYAEKVESTGSEDYPEYPVSPAEDSESGGHLSPPVLGGVPVLSPPPGAGLPPLTPNMKAEFPAGLAAANIMHVGQVELSPPGAGQVRQTDCYGKVIGRIQGMLTLIHLHLRCSPPSIEKVYYGKKIVHFVLVD